MQIYYCVICDHYHEYNPQLPCHIFKEWSLQETAFSLDYDVLMGIRRKSQAMLSNPKCYVQTIKATS